MTSRLINGRAFQLDHLPVRAERGTNMEEAFLVERCIEHLASRSDSSCHDGSSIKFEKMCLLADALAGIDIEYQCETATSTLTC